MSYLFGFVSAARLSLTERWKRDEHLPSFQCSWMFQAHPSCRAPVKCVFSLLFGDESRKLLQADEFTRWNLQNWSFLLFSSCGNISVLPFRCAHDDGWLPAPPTWCVEGAGSSQNGAAPPKKPQGCFHSAIIEGNFKRVGRVRAAWVKSTWSCRNHGRWSNAGESKLVWGRVKQGGKPRPQPGDWQLVALEDDQDEKHKK